MILAILAAATIAAVSPPNHDDVYTCPKDLLVKGAPPTHCTAFSSQMKLGHESLTANLDVGYFGCIQGPMRIYFNDKNNGEMDIFYVPAGKDFPEGCSTKTKSLPWWGTANSVITPVTSIVPLRDNPQ